MAASTAIEAVAADAPPKTPAFIAADAGFEVVARSASIQKVRDWQKILFGLFISYSFMCDFIKLHAIFHRHH